MATAKNQTPTNVVPISGGQDTGSGEPEAPAPKPTKPELPMAKGSDLGRYPLYYFHPVLTLADGTQRKCGHQPWGHGTEAAAGKCLRKLAAEAKVRLP